MRLRKPIRILFRLALAASLALLLTATSCRKNNSGRLLVIAFSQANSAEPYRAMQKAMMVKLLQSQPDIQLVVSDAEQDNNRQIAQVETFIRERPSVLIVAPNERAALTEVMGEAIEEKIPVICLERDIALPNYTTYVRSDNLEIGRMVGRYIVEQLTKKYGRPAGNVVALRGLLGVEGEINRSKGAEEILSHYPDIHMVAQPVANWIQAEAKDRMVEVLRVQPKIDVVYGHNDPMAVGAYLAAREAGREKEMIFIGVDGLGGPAGGIRKVMDGVLQATFIYPLCVDKAIDLATQIIRNPSFKPEKEYTLASTMVTPENAAQLYSQYTLPDMH